MLFVSLHKPLFEQQQHIIEQGLREGFNFSCPGGTKNDGPLPKDSGWWNIDRQRVKVGYGKQSYQDTKQLVSTWGHFQLPWAQVAADTPTKPGTAFCVTARVFGLWTAVPLKIVQRSDGRWQGDKPPAGSKAPRTRGQRFAMSAGTLGGHYLAGEERFAVEWNQADDSVWYEIYTFSRPHHPLALLGFPVVRWLQDQFRQQSAREVARTVSQASLARSVKGYRRVPYDPSAL